MVIHTGFSECRMGSGIMFLPLPNTDRHVNLESTIHPNSQGRLNVVNVMELHRENRRRVREEEGGFI
jgi:hypothetical protein